SLGHWFDPSHRHQFPKTLAGNLPAFCVGDTACTVAGRRSLPAADAAALHRKKRMEEKGGRPRQRPAGRCDGRPPACGAMVYWRLANLLFAWTAAAKLRRLDAGWA